MNLNPPKIHAAKDDYESQIAYEAIATGQKFELQVVKEINIIQGIKDVERRDKWDLGGDISGFPNLLVECKYNLNSWQATKDAIEHYYPRPVLGIASYDDHIPDSIVAFQLRHLRTIIQSFQQIELINPHSIYFQRTCEPLSPPFPNIY